jgi:uncharacterized protein YbaR (Trm112 family)
MILLLLKCPQCKKDMKYHTYSSKDSVANKVKKCVYCGRSYKIKDNIIRGLK